jgi:hypothetical protein
MLHLSQHILLPRPPHLRHRILQHCRCSLRIASLWSHRLAHTRTIRVGVMFRRTQRDDIHIRPPRVRCRQRGLPSLSVRKHRSRKEPQGNPLTQHELYTREEQDTKEVSSLVCRRRCRLLLHSHLSHGTQRHPYSDLHCRRLFRHPRHVLRRSRVRLLLPNRTRPHHPTRPRTRSRTPIQNMDHHTHNLLLCQPLPAKQSRIRRAITDIARRSLHGSRLGDLVRMGRKTKREGTEQIPYAGRRQREGRLEVLAALETMKWEPTVVLYSKRHGCIKLRSNEEMTSTCTSSVVLSSSSPLCVS